VKTRTLGEQLSGLFLFAIGIVILKGAFIQLYVDMIVREGGIKIIGIFVIILFS
jgi:hypothetical protein